MLRSICGFLSLASLFTPALFRVQARAISPSFSHEVATSSHVFLAPELTNVIPPAAARPAYVIAHRVLVVKSVIDAISNGANALEIDFYAWKDGWYADHDGTSTSYGDKAQKMFETIAAQRKAGKTVTFVWLDIKNPDYCDPDDPKWRHCSIDALRDLARQFLEPVGVRVLYGFYEAKGKAYPRIRNNLNSNEAINLNGKTSVVKPEFEKHGPADNSKRVYSYGYYNLPFEFGDCQEGDYYTCTEMRQGAASGAFGKVFGWTVATGQDWYVDKLMGTANVDGLIYGFKATYYYDHADTRAAAKSIFDWIAAHPDRRFVAGQNDSPW